VPVVLLVPPGAIVKAAVFKLAGREERGVRKAAITTRVTATAAISQVRLRTRSSRRPIRIPAVTGAPVPGTVPDPLAIASVARLPGGPSRLSAAAISSSSASGGSSSSRCPVICSLSSRAWAAGSTRDAMSS